MAKKATFGSVDQLPSKRWRARYSVDGQTYAARTPDNRPLTFATREEADDWLASTRLAVRAGTWTAPGTVTLEEAPKGPILFGEYAERWVAERDLATRTRDLYAGLLRNRLKTFHPVAVADITPALIRSWWAAEGTAKTHTGRAHAGALLRTILRTAETDGLIPRGSNLTDGIVKAAKKADRSEQMASIAELAALRAAMPARYRAAVDLATWCSLRIGEVIGLQRVDLDLDAPVPVVRVRRSVVRTSAGHEVKPPKNDKARRVTIPPHLVPALREHMDAHAGAVWAFPAAGDRAKPVSADVMREAWEAARAKVGREDLHFHDLRGVGATIAALAGATTRELQDRLDHSTPTMAMTYQRIASERPGIIADAMSKLALAP